MGKNLDDGRKRKIYMRDTPSLSNIKKKNIVASGVRKREGVPHVYFSLVYGRLHFCPIACFLHVYMLQGCE